MSAGRVVAGVWLGLLLAGCNDFDEALAECRRSGRCLDASSAGGGGGGGGEPGGGEGGGGEAGGDGGGGAAGGAAGGDPTCPLHVTAFTNHLVDGPSVVRVAHPGPLAALVPQPNGTYTVLPGTDAGAGQFCVAGVPAGPLLLKLGAGLYVQTPQRSVDLSQWVRGRPGRVERTVNNGFDFPRLGTLAPAWSGDDGGVPEHFALSSDGAALSALVEPDLGAGQRDAGRQVFDVPTDARVEASKGDVVYLLRCARNGPRTCATVQYTTGLVNTGDAGTFIVDAGVLRAVTQDRSASLVFQPPSAAVRYAMNAYDAGYDAGTRELGFLGRFVNRVELWADPHDAGWVEPGALIAKVDADAGATAVSFAYGTPYPGPVSIVAGASSQTQWLAGDGATATRLIRVVTQRVLRHRAADAGTLTMPAPPLAVRLNGVAIEQLPYLSTQSQPIAVSWVTPAANTTQFRVELFSVIAIGAQTELDLVADFWLPGSTTLFMLPPLPAGEYGLRLSALRSVPFDGTVPLKPAPDQTLSQTLVRPFLVK